MKKLAFGLAGMALACAALADTPAVNFDVLEFVVEGNTVLPADQVERVLYPHMGPGKTLRDLESAREALEKAYQDAGFLSVVVSLPNQQLRGDGEVRLEVTEARVERLAVTGTQYHLPSKVRGQVPSLRPGQVPYFPQVQQELAQAQTPAMQITPLLSGGSESDTLNMELKVEDRAPISGSVELDNRQSHNTSRGRLSALASHANLFQKGHTLGLSWQYAPWRPDDTNTLTLLYGLPLGRDDDLTFSLTKSDSDTPIRTSDGGNTLTRGEFYGVRWQHALPARQWPVQHSVSVGVDHKHNDDQTELVDAFNTRKPALRYTTLSFGYNLAWTPAEDRSLNVTTSVATSSHALAGREVDCDGLRLQQFECKRFGARPDFMAWKLAATWSGPLWGEWRVNAHADLQLASGPLVSGEQYSLGGPDTVRGYYDYEQAGDRGWNTRLELVTPSRALGERWRLSALGFWDRGFVALEEALETQVARAHLGSGGLGLRLSGTDGLQIALDLARPIFETQRAETGGFATTTRRQWRAHVSVRQSF